MKTFGKLILVLIAILIAIRIALPVVIKYEINHQLAVSPDYGGHVDGVDLALRRGAIALTGIDLVDETTDAKAHIDRLAVNLNWGRLFHRQLVVGIGLENPVVTASVPHALTEVKKAQAEKPKPAKPAPPLAVTLRRMMPFKIYSFTIDNGEIRVRDTKAKPPTTLRVHDIDLNVENLTNTRQLSETLMATARLRAKIMDEGTAALDLKFDPIARPPKFDLNADLKNLDLPSLNPVFRDQFGIVAGSGTLSLATEDAAADGAFKGYVTPVVKNLQVTTAEKEKGNPIKQAETAVVNVGTAILSSSKKELGTRVPIQGKLKDPHVGIVEAIVDVLRNAVTSAISPKLTGEINLKSVESQAGQLKKQGKD